MGFFSFEQLRRSLKIESNFYFVIFCPDNIWGACKFGSLLTMRTPWQGTQTFISGASRLRDFVSSQWIVSQCEFQIRSVLIDFVYSLNKHAFADADIFGLKSLGSSRQRIQLYIGYAYFYHCWNISGQLILHKYTKIKVKRISAQRETFPFPHSFCTRRGSNVAVTRRMSRFINTNTPVTTKTTTTTTKACRISPILVRHTWPSLVNISYRVRDINVEKSISLSGRDDELPPSRQLQLNQIHITSLSTPERLLNSLVRLPQWKGVISLFKFPAKMWRGESHGESNLVSLLSTSTWNIFFLRSVLWYFPASNSFVVPVFDELLVAEWGFFTLLG